MSKQKIKIKKHKRVQFSKEFRESIAKEYDYTCQLCGKKLKNRVRQRRLDHKIPLSKGGDNSRENIWLLCDKCDVKKKDLLIARASNSAVKKRIESLIKKHPNLSKKLKNYNTDNK